MSWKFLELKVILTRLFTWQAFCFSPSKTPITIVSSPNKTPITAASAASDWGRVCLSISFLFFCRAQHRLPEAGPASTLSGALFFGGGGGGREAAGTGQRAFTPSAAHHLQPTAAGAGDWATDGAAPAWQPGDKEGASLVFCVFVAVQHHFWGGDVALLVKYGVWGVPMMWVSTPGHHKGFCFQNWLSGQTLSLCPHSSHMHQHLCTR